jgi:uncharacterized phosphatase
VKCIRRLVMIYVVRHGQTQWNVEGRLQGRNGLPLNSAGIEQADNLREQIGNIKFDLVFSSPQQRAIQTAEIATGVSPVIDERLNVFDLGEADGLKKSEVILEGILPDPSLYKGVEKTETFIGRIFEFLTELEGRYRGQELNIFISGHRCTTGGIGAYFKGLPADRNILKWSSDNGEFRTYSFK